VPTAGSRDFKMGVGMVYSDAMRMVSF